MTTTFRSKIALLAFVTLFIGTPALAADAETMALAKEYVATVPVENEVKMAIEHMAQQVPPEQRVLFKQLGEKSIDYTKLRMASEVAVADTFTKEEIKAMTDFYKSDVGKSVRQKMPNYDKRMEPVMTEVMQQFVLRLQENNVLPKAPVAQQNQ
ncbi:MAG TPA: DUF2059 domain-containing protein [Alphaproteobacteria bacterium]